jgi:hypothetical protein
MFLIDDIVKLGIQHPDYLRRFVANNLLRLLIIQRRHREPALILGVLLEVYIPQMRVPLVDRIRCRVTRHFLVGGGKAPAALGHVPVNAVVGYDVFEAFQFSDDEGAVCPGTGVGHVEVVSAFFGGEFGVGFVFDEVSEDGGLALEFAGFVAGLDLERLLVGMFLDRMEACAGCALGVSRMSSAVKLQKMAAVNTSCRSNVAGSSRPRDRTYPISDTPLPLIASLRCFVHSCSIRCNRERSRISYRTWKMIRNSLESQSRKEHKTNRLRFVGVLRLYSCH